MCSILKHGGLAPLDLTSHAAAFHRPATLSQGPGGGATVKPYHTDTRDESVCACVHSLTHSLTHTRRDSRMQFHRPYQTQTVKTRQEPAHPLFARAWPLTWQLEGLHQPQTTKGAGLHTGNPGEPLTRERPTGTAQRRRLTSSSS